MSDKIGTVIGVLLAVALYVWLTMLTLGWVHTFIAAVPALSFMQTLAVVLLIRLGRAFVASWVPKPKPKPDPLETLLRASLRNKA